MASIPDANLFHGSRKFAAYLRLVLWQHSIDGNPHLRKRLVVGAHAALYSMRSGKTRTAMANWVWSLLVKKPVKVVAVALTDERM